MKSPSQGPSSAVSGRAAPTTTGGAPAPTRGATGGQLPGIGLLRVMHPIQNLHLLPEKRNAAGVAQAHLAVSVARAYIQAEIAAQGERAALRLLERVADVACDIASVRVFLRFGVDPLEAVPITEFRTTTALHSKRWPQIQREVERSRSTLAKLATKKR